VRARFHCLADADIGWAPRSVAIVAVDQHPHRLPERDDLSAELTGWLSPAFFRQVGAGSRLTGRAARGRGLAR
jgi:hypothetical protein